MGKTYKNWPHIGRYSYFRYPRGHRAALVAEQTARDEGCRAKARPVPPNERDDIGYDSHNFVAYKMIKRMIEKKWSVDKIIRKVIKKFHLEHRLAEKFVCQQLEWKERKDDWLRQASLYESYGRL